MGGNYFICYVVLERKNVGFSLRSNTCLFSGEIVKVENEDIEIWSYHGGECEEGYFWIFSPCSLAEVIKVSDVLAASIIMVMTPSSNDRCGKYLWNVGNLLLDYTAQRTKISTVVRNIVTAFFIFVSMVTYKYLNYEEKSEEFVSI